ncbi:hypothetical protein [Companilactobacillus muriivasis]|uniref:hypothetical protein n=1 Tax=Companilactobacillus muriivasis TaxID=3081444 RepID=UPI0030C78084
MNELKQLQYKLPIIAMDRQYRSLAEKIERTVSEGNDHLTIFLNFKLSDEALDALSEAHISVTQIEDGTLHYKFDIGGIY